jgi:Zn-dependent protease with chaperone function
VTEIKGFFLDGQSATRHEVSLRIQTNELYIYRHDTEVCLASWALSDVYLRDKAFGAEALILGYKKTKRASLRLEEDLAKDWIYSHIPDLSKRTTHAAEGRLAWKIAAGVVCVGAALYFGLPVLAKQVAKHVPQNWEKETFAGSSLNLARFMGAKRECVAPQGLAVLEAMKIRLIGPELAKDIKVRVVDHKMVNAFAAPGQEVILMRGLIDQSKSSSEVVGVLAHELGHVYHRHVLQNMISSAGFTFLGWMVSGGTATDAATLLAQTSYSRDHEREADRFALERLKEANISAKGLAEFFEQLDDKGGDMEHWLELVSTHPMSAERAELLRSYEGGLPPMSPHQWKQLKNICSKRSKI